LAFPPLTLPTEFLTVQRLLPTPSRRTDRKGSSAQWEMGLPQKSKSGSTPTEPWGHIWLGLAFCGCEASLRGHIASRRTKRDQVCLDECLKLANSSLSWQF
jgi:hypothetical protein